ncbi:MAG: saccharopine dehydrogenase NADP-binding domain-containing protein [Bacteroidales bacterium]|nr:saccharopine dehydrogenase NADP-binding domain-containing protein [Bacteroidales bacterium]
MTRRKIIVLGAGLIGKAIAIDLKKSGHNVTAVDLNEEVLNDLSSGYGISGIRADFTGDHLVGIVKKFDLVVGAAPGTSGYRIMERVIRAGKNMVDISFCPEDFMKLDQLAREQRVVVVPDMGVAPGMCNAILGYHHGRMEVESYRCLVGGLPFERRWPLEYKSSWSPMDCIEEYTRPARFRSGGKSVVKPALSDLEKVEFEGIGVLEAWNSDGLRSLLDSFPHIPDMVEKTLRYPGTVDYLKVLRELGYFSTEEVEVKGRKVRPVDLTAALLFPLFKLEKGEKEFTVMRVMIEGKEDGKGIRYEYDLYDEYDPVSDTISMARTTGYACTGVAHLLLNGMLTQTGVIPPERTAIEEENFTCLMQHLRDRGVDYQVKAVPLD